MNMLFIPLTLISAASTFEDTQSVWPLINRIARLPDAKQAIVEKSLIDYPLVFLRSDGSIVQFRTDPESDWILAIMRPCAERVLSGVEQGTLNTVESAAEEHRLCFANQFAADRSGKLTTFTVKLSHN